MLDVATLREATRRRLGNSAVAVELQDTDIDLCIEEAIQELNRYYPGEAFASINASSTQNRYVIEHKNLIGIVEVQFLNPAQPHSELSENPFFNMDQGILAPVAGNETVLSEGYLTLGYLEDFGEIYSSQPQYECGWEFNETTGEREYALYLDLPSSIEYKVSYRYHFAYNPTDEVDCGLPALNPQWERWVTLYTLAAAREILGEIRNKFLGINLPDGSQEQIDGSSQIERGRADKELLLEDLKNRQAPNVIVLD